MPEFPSNSVTRNTHFYFIGFLIISIAAITPLRAQTYYPDRSNPDSAAKHELTITPYISYSELRFLEGPMDYPILYNDAHYLTRSPGFGCSVNYLANEYMYFGLNVDFQSTPFSSMYIRQNYFYNNISNPYKLTINPEIECSFNYFLTDDIDNTSVGVALSYQSIQCNSLSSQTFFPDAIQFGCVNLSVPVLYDFPGNGKSRPHFFVGIRPSFTVWYELDTWNNGRNIHYESIVTSGDENRRPNDLQLSLLFHGGLRYSLSRGIRTQLDFGFGFSTPYYAQLGVVLTLYRGNKEVRKTKKNLFR